MKNKDLLHAMNDIDDKYIAETEMAKQKNKARKRRLAGIGIAAAACLCVAVGAGAWALKRPAGENASSEDGQRKDSGNVPDGIAPTGSDNANPGSNALQGNESQKPGSTEISAVHANYAIAQAEYPECVSYPDETKFINASGELDWDSYCLAEEEWSNERSSRIRQSAGYRDSLYPFYAATMQEFLISGENVNRAYSPLNLYMALSMLAELTDGNSRAQLLTLLNADGIDAVRESASALWNANYSDDGAVTSILTNSLWLNQEISFVEDTMRTLAETYHASSFQGEMGSAEYTQAFHGWLNEQTGGLLTEQIEELELDARTVLALASTIYYRAQWADKFNEGNTAEGTFYAAAGDITCDFMHQTTTQNYYWGDNFSAVCRSLESSGGMWLFLPDEGVSVNELVADEDVLRLIREGDEWENQTTIRVNLSMPKFDIVSDIELVESLQSMGVTDIFDESLSDFNPMTKDIDDIYVSQAKHAARVCVDEEGCTATAFTAMMMTRGAMPPEEEVDFTLDRPFFFVITGADGSILFAGVVEQP